MTRRTAARACTLVAPARWQRTARAGVIAAPVRSGATSKKGKSCVSERSRSCPASTPDPVTARMAVDRIGSKPAAGDGQSTNTPREPLQLPPTHQQDEGRDLLLGRTFIPWSSRAERRPADRRARRNRQPPIADPSPAGITDEPPELAKRRHAGSSDSRTEKYNADARTAENKSGPGSASRRIVAERWPGRPGRETRMRSRLRPRDRNRVAKRSRGSPAGHECSPSNAITPRSAAR